MLKIFDKLEKNVCNVFLNKTANGTGFLINPKFILTDYHVIKKGNDIGVKFHNDEYLYNVTLYNADPKYKDLDIALLELDKEVNFYEYIEVKDRKLNRDERWVTRGYPASKSGRVNNMMNCKHVIHESFFQLDDEGFDIELNFDTSKWTSYVGLSGSPIIVDNCIVGIIISQQMEEKSKELYGLSSKYFKKLIDEVNRKEKNKNEITETIILENGDTFNIELVKVELEDKILYVGKYPVTFDEYDAFCEDTGKEKPNERWGRGKKPVIYVDFKNAKKYCKWLTEHSDSFEYILPSSTDWLKIYKINNLNNHSSVIVWYNKKETSDVNLRDIPNLNICDMFGNVAEWCSDKVSIGGSFRNETLNRMQEKIKRNKTDKFDYLGFRIISITNKEL